MGFERRLVPARDDLIADHLAGFSPDVRSASPKQARVRASVADLRPKPDVATVADTQLLHGEAVNVYDLDADWAWVQSVDDGYVGYVRADALNDATQSLPTHRVITLGTHVYRQPSLKTPVFGQLPFAAQVTVLDTQSGYSRFNDTDWLPDQHLSPIEQSCEDWVAVAELFQGVPYLWGGRSNLGLDCSALVQLARQAAGHRCLRDSDMQQITEGETLPDEAPLQRGDLLFWRGHVGIMRDAEKLLHANGHHMAVVSEPVEQAIDRILKAEDSPVSRRARLS